VLTSGGSVSSLLGLAAARDAVGPGVAYVSDQTHASIKRALLALGFAPDEIRTLGSDQGFRLPATDVHEAILTDRAAGRVPRIVVGTAGTVNTGAVDDLRGLARLCRDEGLWLHVDGAYGGPAALCEAGAAALQGIEQADSLALDPHKWLFQPIDIGCLLVRRPGALEQAFAMNPEYLADTAASEEVNFRDRTLELTRRGRGVKLWLTFRTYGVERIRAAIARGIALAEEAERWLREDGRCEVVTPAQLGIVTFAVRGADAREHAERAAALSRSGYAAVTSTTLRDRSVLRLCTINPRTTEHDIATTLERLVG
jgi:glutamate/tyrosine decarboxylase-like PLP-dependent enzyme